ncbi:hypothetical protein PPERSA_00980 [Pseudocohnilembus persalinus]|uniref:Uncharacterized protein n=1 Tax=Pseudocohnilembus persalinus TaxID=266149 RepID=A0A0V0R932_PSEPJ|nr:hypothetical protein PPERSA_00980 [Pseudocohnilembus persalinus]|eukprot:KRX10810.1 hypothetical protein PPERSA_00980 [Pseudocohnilembus persalinus]
MAICHNNLGNILVEQYNYKEALYHFRQSLKLELNYLGLNSYQNLNDYTKQICQTQNLKNNVSDQKNHLKDINNDFTQQNKEQDYVQDKKNTTVFNMSNHEQEILQNQQNYQQQGVCVKDDFQQNKITPLFISKDRKKIDQKIFLNNDAQSFQLNNINDSLNSDKQMKTENLFSSFNYSEQKLQNQGFTYE